MSDIKESQDYFLDRIAELEAEIACMKPVVDLVIDYSKITKEIQERYDAEENVNVLMYERQDIEDDMQAAALKYEQSTTTSKKD